MSYNSIETTLALQCLRGQSCLCLFAVSFLYVIFSIPFAVSIQYICISIGANNVVIYHVTAPIDLEATNGSPTTINAMRLKYMTYYVEYNVNDV
jgi:hypothetical protein